MLTAICQLKSMTPVTFNKKLVSEKSSNETYDDFEERVWRERCDCDRNGNLILSSQRFKKSICLAAQWLNMQIPGEGKATYTKHFKGGCIVMKNINLGIKREDVDHVKIYTSPRKKDGKRWIHFPIVESWEGVLEINLLDEKITKDVFKKVVVYAGMAVGIGSWRPENGGENGRFEVVDTDFEIIET